MHGAGAVVESAAAISQEDTCFDLARKNMRHSFALLRQLENVGTDCSGRHESADAGWTIVCNIGGRRYQIQIK
jgi:hypothetical protein